MVQVSEYLLDHRRVFDAGNDLDETGAFATNTGLLEGLLMAGCRYKRRWNFQLMDNRFVGKTDHQPN
jgi:hypothetical protein